MHVAWLRERHAGNTCPKCGSALVLGTARKGADAGGSFPGCFRFPKSRYVLYQFEIKNRQSSFKRHTNSSHNDQRNMMPPRVIGLEYIPLTDKQFTEYELPHLLALTDYIILPIGTKTIVTNQLMLIDNDAVDINGNRLSQYSYILPAK